MAIEEVGDQTETETLIAAVRSRARDLLASGQAHAVLGWSATGKVRRPQPALFAEEELEHLVLEVQAGVNLAVYLTRPEVRRRFPVAVVARPGDMRSMIVLIQEGQLREEEVKVIPLDVEAPQLLPGDRLTELLPWLREHYPARDFSDDLLEPVREVEALPLPERWEYWKEEFARCLRCYACREACPLCYCERCIADEGHPQWLEPSAHQRGNLAWNIIRADHLAGRCTLCGACESACPVDIPLMTLNRGLALRVWEEFGYAAGLDPDATPLLSTWHADDSNELFR